MQLRIIDHTASTIDPRDRGLLGPPLMELAIDGAFDISVEDGLEVYRLFDPNRVIPHPLECTLVVPLAHWGCPRVSVPPAYAGYRKLVWQTQIDQDSQVHDLPAGARLLLVDESGEISLAVIRAQVSKYLTLGFEVEWGGSDRLGRAMASAQAAREAGCSTFHASFRSGLAWAGCPLAEILPWKTSLTEECDLAMKLSNLASYL